MEDLGLAKYAQNLREQEMDLDVLGELAEADLAGLDIPLGPRRKILRALRERIEVTSTSDVDSDPARSANEPVEHESRRQTVLPLTPSS